MSTATFVLAMVLASGFKDFRRVTPPSPHVATAGKTIEVNIGPIATDVGGPPDEAVLSRARLGATADDAVAFFRLRTPPGPPRARIETLVHALGGVGTAVRDAAQRELVAIGSPALPLVREAANDIDEPDVSVRARQILAAATTANASELVVQYARVLAARKPAAAAEVLLGYLPYCEDSASFQECEAALVVVGMSGGKPDPALAAALKDANGIRRGTAAQVLSQLAGPASYPAIRTLLKDPLPSVRLRVALGLVGAHDGEAVPVLIDLVGELPVSLKPAAEAYLHDLAGEWAVSGPKGRDLMSRKLRREVWQAWWKSTDGSTLLEEFRSRTPTEEDRERIDSLIKKLGGLEADAAVLALAGMGKKAAAQLRRASNQAGPTGSLARKALDSIERNGGDPLPSVAARLLALRKPEGTVEAMLAYLAVAESEEAQAQIQDLLATVAVPGGKADEALIKALKDRSPVRRVAAAVAICRGRAAAQYARLREMTEDKDPVVRFRVGEGLAVVGDKAGVGAVIASLKDLPADNVPDAEELLDRVAGGKGPTVVRGDDAASRARAAEAWAKWWKDNEATADLSKLDFVGREGGQMLVIEQSNPAKGNGRVLEIDRNGRIKWDLACRNPNYASLLRNGNVLLMEYGSQTGERDRKGKQITTPISWGSAIYCERLPEGKTLIGCTNGVFIYDKTNARTFTHYYNTSSLAGMRAFSDGAVSYVSHAGHFVKLDKTGKQVKTFNLSWAGRGIAGADVFPDDRVVVSQNSPEGKVACYSPDGKTLWEVKVASPSPPSVTAGGNVLVSVENQTKILEIDRRGRIVKTLKGFDFKPYRVIRR